MKCTQCGTVASPDTNYCPQCGAPISTATSEVPSNHPSSISKDRTLSVVWVWLGGIAVIGAYAALLIPAFAGQIGDAQTGIGVIFWSSIFFLLLWKYRGRKGWHGSLLGFVLGLVLFAAAPVIVGYQRAAEKSRAETVAGLEYVVDQMEELFDATNQTNADGTPKLIDETFLPSADASGLMAVLQEFIADVMNQSAALTNDYLSELNSIGWNTIFDPTRLQADGSLEEGRRMVAEARIIISNYENRADEILDNTRKKIQTLNVTAAQKNMLEQNFVQGMRSSATFREKMWNLERATVDETEKIIDLLAGHPQAWSIDDSQILFESQQQLDEFNEHIENIDSFVVEQMEIQAAALERQRKRVDEFR